MKSYETPSRVHKGKQKCKLCTSKSEKILFYDKVVERAVQKTAKQIAKTLLKILKY